VNYLEIPIQFVFTGGKEKGFFIGAGPSIMLGLSGQSKFDRNGVVTTQAIKFGGDNQEGPLTLGINAMVGYSIGKVVVNLNYTQGLTNQPTDTIETGNVNHLALRLGYIFR
jgi:hypothetical protein